MLWSYGWSNGTNHTCQATRTHETNENEAYIMRNDAIISILSLTANSEVSRASVSATAAGSFTLSWGVQSDTTAMVIHYQVIGGTDITNVSVFNSTTQNFSTGNHSWNGTGTTFTPDFALTMQTPANGTPVINTIAGGTDQSVISIGAAASTTKQWQIMARSETAAAEDSDQYLDNGSCIGSMNISTGVIQYRGVFVSFNNAAGGGITINVTTAASNTGQNAFLLVKGGKWDCNVFQQPVTTGTQNVSLTDSTVVPKLVQMMGIGSATEGTVVLHHYLGIGGADGTREGNCWNGSTSDLPNFQTARSCDTGKLYRQGGAPNATASSTSVVGECDMQSMSTAGQFTLDWTTCDTIQRQCAFWMVGEVGASNQNIERPITESAITISEASLSIARNKTRGRTETVTASD